MAEKEKRKRRTKAELQETYQQLSNYLSDGMYVGEYNGKEILGFKKGKTYAFKLTHPPNECYLLKELEDGISINYASTISIKQNWLNIRSDE